MDETSQARVDTEARPRGRPRTWSAEDDALLRDLYLEGKSPSYLADRFETSTSNIRSRLSRLGVKKSTSQGQRGGLKRPKRPDDIATRLAVLLGQEPRPPMEPRTFTDDELLRCAGQGSPPETIESLWTRIEPWVRTRNPVERDSPILARLAGLDAYCREAVFLELMDHQLAMAYICLSGKRALCLAGRQSGKDVTQAALALWEALTLPNARIVMVSGAQRQSDALMEKVLGSVARNLETFDSVASSSREALTFRNGSFIKALPATGLIRGETATRVLVNEARDVLNEEETYAALEPMLLVTGGSMAIFTTPLGKSGRVWDAFNSPIYLKVQIPSTASKYATAEHLERQRLEMSAARYANEYEAQFLDIQSSFFSAESIARCAKEYDLAEIREPGKRYTLGIDWARTRDTSVMVVVSRDTEDRLKVEYIRDFFNVPMPEQVAHARRLHGLFRFENVVSEYAGLGIGPSDQLRVDGLTVEFFKPTAEQKALGYDGLKSRLEKGTITIPMHPKLLTELRTLQFKLTEHGTLTIHHPGGGSDDYADALMLAAWPWKESQRYGFVRPETIDKFLAAWQGREYFIDPEDRAKAEAARPKTVCACCARTEGPWHSRGPRYYCGKCDAGPNSDDGCKWEGGEHL